MSDNTAGFQALGGAEFAHEPALQGDFLGLVNNRIGFLGGNLEMAVFLQLALGRFPPFLPIVLDHIGHQDALD